MSDISELDSKYCKKIYNYISPIMIIYDEYKELIENNKNHLIFMILLDIHYDACHPSMYGDFMEKLFVNMVLFYHKFDFDLTDHFTQIEELWDDIDPENQKFKLSNKLDITNYKNPRIKGNDKIFCDEFKQLLNFMYNYKEITEEMPMLAEFGERSKTNIKLIYKYVSPIIFWYKNVKEKFNEENKTDLLFQISRYTRTLACNFSTLVTKDNLPLLIGNICIIYLAFGVDLFQNEINVKLFLVSEPAKCTIVNEEITIVHDVATQSLKRNKVINSIRNILVDKFNPWNKEYFLFAKYLHHLVSTKIPNGVKLTKVFLNFQNKVRWCRQEGQFILDYKLDREFFKLSSPLFVWIKVVDSLNAEEFNKNEKFYISMNNMRKIVINYFVTLKCHGDEENSVIEKLYAFHEPILDFINKNGTETYKRNLTNIQYYNFFKEMVEHSAYQLSPSFIFEYKRNEDANHAKLCDIFKFSGMFFIFLDYFQIFTEAPSDIFYKNVKKVSDLIIKYRLHEIRNKLDSENSFLLDEAINGINSIFSDFRKMKTSDYNIFHTIFSQLYFYIVTSNSNKYY